jgi:hypothetical protein
MEDALILIIEGKCLVCCFHSILTPILKPRKGRLSTPGNCRIWTEFESRSQGLPCFFTATAPSEGISPQGEEFHGLREF